MPYHEGELEVQRRAGVEELAQRVGRIIGDEIPAMTAAFFARRPFIITSTVAAGGAVTCSLLGGEPGFAEATSPHAMRIAPTFGHAARVRADVTATGLIGMLAIDFANKRRMRLNGRATIAEGALIVTPGEVYANCPQYIHTQPASGEDVEHADTFFIATAHPVAGADASHRGGPAGFVHDDGARISWPDYSGNNMFNTLGNLAAHPRCGLLFIHFAQGTALQIRGRGSVEWSEPRMVHVDVDERESGTLRTSFI